MSLSPIMVRMSLCVIATALLLASPPRAHTQESDPPSRIFVEGEDLIYNVRYGFIDLGQVRIKITKSLTTPSYMAYEGKAYIDSYPKVPIVDLHAIFESLVDSGAFSHQFIGRLKENGRWDQVTYLFEYDKNRVLIEVANSDMVVVKRDTMTIGPKHHDGLSLFYYARAQLYSGAKANVPVVIKEDKYNAFIDFKHERTSVEVDAVDYPVDVIAFDGRADFVGIFGFTGGFEGWFSADEARVPIMAKMKVFIGSVTIELMKWTRPGWNPPRAKG